jgi:hypothetical protein
MRPSSKAPGVPNKTKKKVLPKKSAGCTAFPALSFEDVL